MTKELNYKFQLEVRVLGVGSFYENWFFNASDRIDAVKHLKFVLDKKRELEDEKRIQFVPIYLRKRKLVDGEVEKSGAREILEKRLFMPFYLYPKRLRYVFPYLKQYYKSLDISNCR